MGRITFNILVAAASTIIAVTVNAQTIEQLPSRTATTQPFLFGSETINSAVESALSLSPTSTIRQEEEEDPNDFRVFWNNGLRMETNDGRFQVRLGGRTMYDWTFWGDGSAVSYTHLTLPTICSE